MPGIDPYAGLLKTVSLRTGPQTGLAISVGFRCFQEIATSAFGLLAMTSVL